MTDMGRIMKLVFPNGEHDNYELSSGANVIGSHEDCDIVLKGGGVAERHAEINQDASGVVIRVEDLRIKIEDLRNYKY